MADATDLGSVVEKHVGSIPIIRTNVRWCSFPSSHPFCAVLYNSKTSPAGFSLTGGATSEKNPNLQCYFVQIRILMPMIKICLLFSIHVQVHMIRGQLPRMAFHMPFLTA